MLFLLLFIIDTVTYGATPHSLSPTFQFVSGAKYPLYDVATVIYCSGAPVFGVSVEIYPMVSLLVVNVILQATNCGDVEITLVFLIRIVCLAIAVELAYRNFTRLCPDQQPRENSSHVMLHQSLLFSLSILFFASAGIGTVFEGAFNECTFERFTCGVIKMYSPIFAPQTPCDGSFVEYVTSREELRILRDWMVLNIAFYAIFNYALFDFVTLKRAKIWQYTARLTLLILFLSLATGYLVVNVAPFEMSKTKIFFDVIECLLFVCAVSLMIFNLVRTARGRPVRPDRRPLEEEPHILPKI